ncbi:MAG: hypothetical protein ACI89L_001476 [Phycisphaerales bacterium]|jgi:hypothetical protein
MKNTAMTISTMARGAVAILCGALLAVPLGCRSAAKPDAGHTTQAHPAPDPTGSIALAIDAWHEAAGRADFDAYFGGLTHDAVFMGTDATERWTRPEFEAFARPYFDDGSGWLYEPIDRKIMTAPDGKAAWFDERLANAGLGECRGTGVVQLGPDGNWRIAHYSLTIPIPNAIARDVAGQIQALTAEPAADAQAPSP